MAVIKYRDSMPESKYEDDPHQDREIGSAWRYEEVYNPKNHGKELTRDEAIDLINEQGLVEVYRCKEGVIWDKPDEPMRRKYGRNSI